MSAASSSRSPVLAGLPPVGDRRMAVRLRPAGLKAVKQGHPWVFSESIASVNFEAAPGTLAVIFDKDRKFLAIGLWDPGSPIRVRVLHQGGPVTIDADWIGRRVEAAAAARAGLVSGAETWSRTTAYRLVNGEGDGFSGLVVDRYNEVAVIKVYSVAWVPWLGAITDALIDRLGLETVVLRVSRNCASTLEVVGLVDGMVLAGPPPPEPLWFVENGLEFAADVVQGQKTGHFLDQRDNRQRVRALVDIGRRTSLLDVFSCTGGFSVYAAAGGARLVMSVDSSRPALRAGEVNMAANVASGAVDGDGLRHEPIAGDAFEVMESLVQDGSRFDVVVVDPPAFASRQREMASALRAYRRLTALALPLVASGGVLVQASCSSRIGAEAFRDAVVGEASRVGRPLGRVQVFGHGLDHPTVTDEGEYLKAVFALVP